MRIFLRRRAGYRLVRGGHVIDFQKGISKSITASLSIDGVFGKQTETALKLWQSKQGLPVTGQVDELNWQVATGTDLPSMFRRSLAITAAFEGHGYTFAAGNWDNAYLTWGIIGFTLKHGNFGKVINAIETRHPGLLSDVIGPQKSDELLDIISASASQKKAWGNSISILPKKYRIRSDWEDAFKALGNRPEVRAIQDDIARSVYWKRAVSDIKKYGKLTEADAALFFDTAVQNGGINTEKADLIADYLAGAPGADHRTRLGLIAKAIAKGSNPKFHDDVLSRKGTIAAGEGRVHGSDYFIADWMIDDSAIDGDDLNR